MLCGCLIFWPWLFLCYQSFYSFSPCNLQKGRPWCSASKGSLDDIYRQPVQPVETQKWRGGVEWERQTQDWWDEESQVGRFPQECLMAMVTFLHNLQLPLNRGDGWCSQKNDTSTKRFVAASYLKSLTWNGNPLAKNPCLWFWSTTLLKSSWRQCDIPIFTEGSSTHMKQPVGSGNVSQHVKSNKPTAICFGRVTLVPV